jgi:hypothetical protein
MPDGRRGTGDVRNKLADLNANFDRLTEVHDDLVGEGLAVLRSPAASLTSQAITLPRRSRKFDLRTGLRVSVMSL